MDLFSAENLRTTLYRYSPLSMAYWRQNYAGHPAANKENEFQPEGQWVFAHSTKIGFRGSPSPIPVLALRHFFSCDGHPKGLLCTCTVPICMVGP